MGISFAAYAGSGVDVQVVAVDAARYPVVAIDLAVPTHELTGALPAEAFSVAGASELSVTRLDPADTAVCIVLDDRPGVSPAVVAGEQGGAVEFVRALDPGTLLAVSSPAGVLVAAGDDKATQMRAIETLGAPRPDPSNQLVRTLIDSATRLATTPSTRRVVVAVVADGAGLDRPVAELRATLAASRAQLHVVSVGPPLDPELVAVAVATGGTTVTTDPRGLIAALDAVSGPLTGRYRLTARMAAPGTHAVRVAFGIATSQVNVNVAAPSAPPTSPVPVTQVVAPVPSPSSVPGTAGSPAAAGRATAATAPVTTPSSSPGPGSHRSRTGLLAAVSASAVVAVGVAAFSRRRTRARRSSGARSPVRSPAPSRRTTAPSAPRARDEDPTGPAEGEPRHATAFHRAARSHPDVVVEETLEFAHLRAWPCRRTVTSAERPVALTAREFDVLELFMRCPERLLTPDDIAVAVWPTGTSPHPGTVVSCVGAMRRKLETHGESRLVHTVRGAGYVLEEDVSSGPHPRPIELERRGRDYGRIS